MGAVDIGVLFGRPVLPIGRVPRDALVVLHELNIGQLGQPDFHRTPPDVAQLFRVGRRHGVGFVDQLVVLGVLPAGEVGLMRAGNRDRNALIKP